MLDLTKRSALFALAFLAVASAAAAPLLLRKSSASRSPVPSRDAQLEARRLNTLGVAYLNQTRSADAEKLFAQALQADPAFSIARLNLGVAFLSQQKIDAAREALSRAAKELPDDPFAWYNLGLAEKDHGDPQDALHAFTRVTQLAPGEPDAFYFIGYLQTQLKNYDAAIAAFQSALKLAEYHASSQFGLARAYQRKGDTEAARIQMARFQKIVAGHLGTPFGSAYGDQGKFSVAELPGNASLPPPAPISVTFASEPLLSSASAASSAPGPAAGVCFFDFDGDGKPDIFLVSAVAGHPGHLLRNLGGGHFADVTQSSGLAAAGAGMGCAAGDYDNDGKTDLAVCDSGGVVVFHNEGDGKFGDATKALGIRREPGCAGLTFVDYDHDGDLDLYLTVSADSASSASGPRNLLWRNNGNSTFTDVTAETALGLEATGAGVVTTDFNNDRAIDFVLAGGSAGASIHLNPREGKFTALPGIDFHSQHLPPAVGVVAFDFDKDGWMDLAFTHSGAPGISLWRNVEGKRLERVSLPDPGWNRGWGLAALDYDNDGWLDLAAVGEKSSSAEIRLFRNTGPAGWMDVSAATHLSSVELSHPRALAVADVSGNGAQDLLISQLDAAPVFLRNEGAARNGWLEIDLKALNDNKSAIGTKVEVYAGALSQKWEVAGASGYLGQNAPAIHAGLGSEKSAELVRLLWPSGVPQDEVNISGRQTHSIPELDRRGSSCPVLFAWNGREFEFIADMIGPGVVGHWIAPNQRDVPDPTEYLKVSGRSLQQRDGLLSFRFLEPMEETVYLDQVRLLAIDHPSAYEVFPNERFASTPPFPEFRVIASRNSRIPLGAWDERGNDVLPLVSRQDRKYVAGFASLPFAGFAKLHWLELDLGAWDAYKPLRLILDGYTDYFTATSMYAADQANIKVIVPYVEAQNARGQWIRVVDDMGFPAGLARTMVADLTGKLPAGTRRIRIVSNLKIYWDAVRIDQTPDPRDARVQEVPLAGASLAYLGYPREIRLHPASDTAYSYSQRSMTGPYARAAGNYTRYGGVRDLVRNSDDRFAIFSSGEGLKLDFDPRGLRPLPAGWIRDYFFYADGFEKDMDFYAAHAFTVEPLPRHTLLPYPYPAGEAYPEDSEHLRYQLEYNTRERSGRLPADLRYDYKPLP